MATKSLFREIKISSNKIFSSSKKTNTIEVKSYKSKEIKLATASTTKSLLATISTKY